MQTFTKFPEYKQLSYSDMMATLALLVFAKKVLLDKTMLNSFLCTAVEQFDVHKSATQGRNVRAATSPEVIVVTKWITSMLDGMYTLNTWVAYADGNDKGAELYHTSSKVMQDYRLKWVDMLIAHIERDIANGACRDNAL